MNFKHIAIATLCATSLSLAQAEVKQIDKAAAAENSVIISNRGHKSSYN